MVRIFVFKTEGTGSNPVVVVFLFFKFLITSLTFDKPPSLLIGQDIPLITVLMLVQIRRRAINLPNYNFPLV